MKGTLLSNEKVQLIIKLIMIAAFAGLIFSIATDYFSKNIEIIFCAVGTIASYIAFLGKNKRS